MAFWSKDKGDKDAGQDPSTFVAKKDYPKAIALYRAQIAAQPGNYMLRHKIADVLCMAGKEKDSLPDYSAAADGYAREGFLIKAVAILKKLQKLDPSNASIEARLSRLSAACSSSSSVSLSSSSADSSPGVAGGRGGVAGEDLSLDMEALDESPSIPLASMDDAPPPAAPPLASVPSDMATTPLFSDLQPEELLGVVGRLRHHAFAPGSTLVKEGDSGASLFVLSDGRVKVTTRGPKGRQVHLAELKEGDFFGEVSLLTGKPRTATITSLEQTEVLELTREDLEDLESKHPRIRDVIKDFYEKRVASTIEAMILASRAPKGPSRG